MHARLDLLDILPAGLATGPRTPVPDWDGAAMDDDMAIDGLPCRERPRPG